MMFLGPFFVSFAIVAFTLFQSFTTAQIRVTTGCVDKRGSFGACCIGDIELNEGLTSIADNAFMGCAITSVRFSSTVTKIGHGAFQGNLALKTVAIPDSVISVGNGAFFMCKALASVSLGVSVQSIGDKAFYDTLLTTVSIPQSVTSIGVEAFQLKCLDYVRTPTFPVGITAPYPDCDVTVLDPVDPADPIDPADPAESACIDKSTPNDDCCKGDIVISETIYFIQDGAFSGCSLASVTIPSSVVGIGEDAFAENDLARVELSNGLMYIADGAFRDNNLVKVNIPDSVVKLGAEAFSGNDLAWVRLSERLVAIGDSAFADNKLTEIKVPRSITSIGSGAFADNELSSVVIPETVGFIGEGAFGDQDGLEDFCLTFLGSPLALFGTIIPSCDDSSMPPVTKPPVDSPNPKITTGCVNKRSQGGACCFGDIAIEEKEVYIADGAFSECTINSVVIGDNVLGIGKEAFSKNKLTYVEVGRGVVSIDAFAFASNLLLSVILPENVLKIGVGAFSNNMLVSVRLAEGLASIGDRAFLNNGITIITIPSSTTSIGAGAFRGNLVTSVNLPDGLQAIGDNAFDADTCFFYEGEALFEFLPLCEKMPQVTDPSTGCVDKNSNNGACCSGDIEIDSSVYMIANKAFFGCSLTSVIIPDSVMGIGSFAFYGNQISSITVGAGVIYIGDEAFNANQLISLYIPDSVLRIGSDAFANNKIQKLLLGEGLVSIGGYAFMNNNLTEITMPWSLISIGEFAFDNNNLASVTIPSNIGLIGEGAFNANGENVCLIFEGVVFDEFLSCSTDNFVKRPDTPWGDDDIFSLFNDDQLNLIDDPFSFFFDDSKGVNVTTDCVDKESKNGACCKGHIEISATVKGIPDNAFKGCNIEAVKIPEGIVSIGAMAFYECKKLAMMAFPDSLTSIGDSAFMNDDLWYVSFGEGLTAIGESAFRENHLSQISIPDSVITIGGGAFYDNRLAFVDFGKQVKEIGWGAFAQNYLTFIDLPASLEKIGDFAFGENDLISAMLPEGVTSIGDEIFDDNKKDFCVVYGGDLDLFHDDKEEGVDDDDDDDDDDNEEEGDGKDNRRLQYEGYSPCDVDLEEFTSTIGMVFVLTLDGVDLESSTPEQIDELLFFVGKGVAETLSLPMGQVTVIIPSLETGKRKLLTSNSVNFEIILELSVMQLQSSLGDSSITTFDVAVQSITATVASAVNDGSLLTNILAADRTGSLTISGVQATPANMFALASPTLAPTPHPNKTASSSISLSLGASVGIAIAGAAVIATISFVVYKYFWPKSSPTTDEVSASDSTIKKAMNDDDIEMMSGDVIRVSPENYVGGGGGGVAGEAPSTPSLLPIATRVYSVLPVSAIANNEKPSGEDEL